MAELNSKSGKAVKAAARIFEDFTSQIRLSDILKLDKSVIPEKKINLIFENVHTTDFFQILDTFTYSQLTYILDEMIHAAILYYQQRFNMTADVKTIKSRFENLLDYKERTGCSEPIDSCLTEGCHNINIKCAARKIKEDILCVTKIFESRANRSHIPHIAIELFFKKVITDFNCIGLILSDKYGSPKVFITDGSRISSVITGGIRRLSDAIADYEFQFSKPDEPYLVFNQKFPIDETLAHKLLAFEKNKDFPRFIKQIMFSSLGFDVAHEKTILTIIYIGDNMLVSYLQRLIDGITRIKIETDPDAKLRETFGRKIKS
jgi:hypothetical protein